MDVIVERPAALDVHKAQVTACVRPPTRDGGREPHLAEFATTVRRLLGAHARLVGSSAPISAITSAAERTRPSRPLTPSS